MIPVAHPIRKPRNFARDCETPGNAWLAANPVSNRFPALWRKYQPQLAAGFHDRCGWWAMRIADGAVDHYLSKKFHRDRAYDWNNYRYISTSVNSSKGNLDDKVLDPFEIQPGWFEVQLPSMLLKRTSSVPPAFQAKADFTIKKLRLVSWYALPLWGISSPQRGGCIPAQSIALGPPPPISPAPTGRHIPAQGIALGSSESSATWMKAFRRLPTSTNTSHLCASMRGNGAANTSPTSSPQKNPRSFSAHQQTQAQRQG
jgi:hypothetical protein